MTDPDREPLYDRVAQIEKNERALDELNAQIAKLEAEVAELRARLLNHTGA